MQPTLAAVAAWRLWRTPSAVLRSLRQGGISAIEEAWSDLSAGEQVEVARRAEDLEAAGVHALLWGEGRYPHALAELRSAPPILFTLGSADLLDDAAVGVCGSRNASAAGLEAARVLSEAVAAQHGVVVAGNALGVDAEAQGAALVAGGKVISVIPEGIEHFRLRTGSSEVEFADERLLVVSQFPPRQPWSVGGAMTRNELIVSLSSGLVVIEAGERGGTLAAGQSGIKRGRTVVALQFGNGTPRGNELLIERGAVAVKTHGALRDVVRRLLDSSPTVAPRPEQIPLAL